MPMGLPRLWRFCAHRDAMPMGMLCLRWCCARLGAVPTGLPCPWGCCARLGVMPMGRPCSRRGRAYKDAMPVVVLCPLVCCAHGLLALCKVCRCLLRGRGDQWDCQLELQSGPVRQ